MNPIQKLLSEQKEEFENFIESIDTNGEIWIWKNNVLERYERNDLLNWYTTAQQQLIDVILDEIISDDLNTAQIITLLEEAKKNI